MVLKPKNKVAELLNDSREYVFLSFRLNAMSQLGGSECFPCSREKFFSIVPNLCASMT